MSHEKSNVAEKAKKQKRPVKKANLLTDKEYAVILKMGSWPVEKAVLWLCGVRKPWSDNEYPPYGPLGQPTYKQVLEFVKAAVKKGEIRTTARFIE